MKILKPFITAGLLALGFLAAPAVQAGNKLPSGTDYGDIGPKIEAFVDEHKATTAGMETAVFTADETIYENHFGYMDKEKKLKADEGSVFEWGSTTKTTVWISVMQLVEAGKIDLKEDIRAYLPKNFLKNLRYDKPVTMLDLMNHKGGFQETYTNAFALDYDSITPLKDYLANTQPPQVYEPGTVTAYSNWGAGLAGYIVEHVSGQTFASYVQDHIFQPLGMKHTSINPDRSDNAYVKQQRARNQSYDAEGKAIGSAVDVVNVYPAGSILGTLDDLKTYAQALLNQDEGVLFKKKSTWDKLFSASDVYAGTDIARNRHGFWTTEYAVSVTQHSGNTDGYSNGLMLDLKNKVGLVVMTNQAYEQAYNAQMPELVFGKYKDSPYVKKDKTEFKGYYQGARGFQKGPFKSFAILSITSGSKLSNLLTSSQSFYTVGKLPDGRQIINMMGNDLISVPNSRIRLMYGSAIAAGLAIVYALGHFLVSLLAWIIRKIRKQSRPAQSKLWQHLISGLTLLAGSASVYIVMSVNSGGIYQQIGYIAVCFALIGLALLGILIWRMLRWPKGQLGWNIWLSYGLTVLAALAIIWNIYFWDLYQWWVV